jgi:hypothetical protein
MANGKWKMENGKWKMNQSPVAGAGSGDAASGLSFFVDPESVSTT